EVMTAVGESATMYATTRHFLHGRLNLIGESRVGRNQRGTVDRHESSILLAEPGGSATSVQRRRCSPLFVPRLPPWTEKITATRHVRGIRRPADWVILTPP